jgi:hypothetical protein
MSYFINNLEYSLQRLNGINKATLKDIKLKKKIKKKSKEREKIKLNFAVNSIINLISEVSFVLL